MRPRKRTICSQVTSCYRAAERVEARTGTLQISVTEGRLGNFEYRYPEIQKNYTERTKTQGHGSSPKETSRQNVSTHISSAYWMLYDL